MREEHIKRYKEKDRDILETSYKVSVARVKNKLNRIEEIALFAKKMGYKKLGIAHCKGLAREAEKLEEILSKDFEIVRVGCNSEEILREEIGVEEINPGNKEIACNPLAQADLINEAGVDLVILLGSCLGHDIIFLKNVKPLVTQLIVKDIVHGHKTVEALQ